MKSMVHEVGIINSLVHALHAKPNTDAINSFVRPELFSPDEGEPDITASRINTRICHGILMQWYDRNVAVWSRDSTPWIFHVSKYDIPFNTYSFFTSGKKNASYFSSAWIAISSKIPFCLHILWVFLEILWFPSISLSWSSFNKGNNR